MNNEPRMSFISDYNEGRISFEILDAIAQELGVLIGVDPNGEVFVIEGGTYH